MEHERATRFLYEGALYVARCEDLSALSLELNSCYETDELTREFRNNDDCLEFFQRVRANLAQAVAFKEFPYPSKKGDKPQKVEREIWYRDFSKTEEEKKYVIVHLHFADDWDQNLAKRHEKQQVKIVTQINLRHFTTFRTQGTGAYSAMFESAFLEQSGYRVYPNSASSTWSDRYVMITLKPENTKNIRQWFKGDQPLPRDRTAALMQPEESGLGSLELSDLLFEFLNKVDDDIDEACRVSSEERDYAMPSDIGVEVLAVGNDRYCIQGLKHSGKLENCVNDADAVVKAFAGLGAKCKLAKNVQDRTDLRVLVERWAKAKLRNPSVRTAFFFWAGHALCANDGLTHLIPTFEYKQGAMHISSIHARQETFAVEELIEIVREHSDCGLIVCLDSCRTQQSLENSKEWSTSFSTNQGADVGVKREVYFWYATAFGHVSSDGNEGHSPFTESLLASLMNVNKKTWHDLWLDTMEGTLKRTNNKQLPSQYGPGLAIERYILPVTASDTLALSLEPKSKPMKQANLPVPFTILCACYGSHEDALAQGEKECTLIKNALLAKFTAKELEDYVQAQACCFTSAAQLIEAVSSTKPSILQLSCCQPSPCYWLSLESLNGKILIQALCDYKHGLHGMNICPSLLISHIPMPRSYAESLTDCVDNMIIVCGSSKDQNMARFNIELFRLLGSGVNLAISFNGAQGTVSDQYMLIGDHAQSFRLPDGSALRKSDPAHSLFKLLKKHTGLSKVAHQITTDLGALGVIHVDQFSDIKEDNLQNFNLSSLQIRTLQRLIASQLSPSDASGASTEGSSSESDEEYHYHKTGFNIIALRNIGEVQLFWAQMKGFMGHMVQNLDSPSSQCSWSSLLLMLTLRHIFSSQETLQNALLHSPVKQDWQDEENMLHLLEYIITHKVEGSIFMERARKLYSGLAFSASVLAVDAFIKKLNIPHYHVWETEVLKAWTANHEGPWKFLRRANKFLKSCLQSTRVLGDAISTTSHVSFLLTDHLSSNLLHLYVQSLKLQEGHSSAHVRELLQGFVLFISSDGTCTSVTEDSVLCCESLKIAAQHLDCLARQRMESLERALVLRPILSEMMEDLISFNQEATQVYVWEVPQQQQPLPTRESVKSWRAPVASTHSELSAATTTWASHGGDVQLSQMGSSVSQSYVLQPPPQQLLPTRESVKSWRAPVASTHSELSAATTTWASHGGNVHPSQMGSSTSQVLLYLPHTGESEQGWAKQIASSGHAAEREAMFHQGPGTQEILDIISDFQKIEDMGTWKGWC